MPETSEQTGSIESGRACAALARIISRTAICAEHVSVEFTHAAFPRSEPGQFLQLALADTPESAQAVRDWPAGGFPELAGGDWQAAAFLRRPFSIADQWIDGSGGTHLVVISRTVGIGTRWLEHVRPGDTLDVTGPLGHGFEVPAEEMPLVLIGGGVGIPPLLYLAKELHARGRRDVTLIFGAMSGALLPVRLAAEPTTDGSARACLQLADQADYGAIITTNDGSLGLRGLVTDGLAAWHAARQSGPSTPAGLVFACGPNPMLSALAQQTRALGLGCQLCIERTMGCGLGTCLSCVVRVRDASRPQGWRWALTCTDGPVFDRDALVE